MRAYWIALGLASVVNFTGPADTASAVTVDVKFTKAELAQFCKQKGGDYSPDDGTSAYTCQIGDGDSKTIFISCFEGNCKMGRKSNASLPGSATISIKQAPTISSGIVRDASGAASVSIRQKSTAASVNSGIATGAAQGSIAVSPLKQIRAGASTITGAVSMSSGRATLRQP